MAQRYSLLSKPGDLTLTVLQINLKERIFLQMLLVSL